MNMPPTKRLRWSRFGKKRPRGGIDLDRYFKVQAVHKYFRSPEDQRLLDFGREMLINAFQKEMLLPLRNLRTPDLAL